MATASRLHRTHHSSVKGTPLDSPSRITAAVALTAGAAMLAADRMNRLRRSVSVKFGLKPRDQLIAAQHFEQC